MKTKQDTNMCRTIGQLESHIINLNESIQELKCALDSMQRRLVIVEKHHSFIGGTVAALLFVGTIFGALMDHIVKWVIGR